MRNPDHPAGVISRPLRGPGSDRNMLQRERHSPCCRCKPRSRRARAACGWGRQVSHPHDVVPRSQRDVCARLRIKSSIGSLYFASMVRVAGCHWPTHREQRGPERARQLAFHPKLPIAWVLSSPERPRHACWDADRGTLARVPSEHCPATDFTGYSTAAECRVQRGSLCLRGHDSVAAGAASGLLTPIGWQPMQGRTPRFIGLNPTGRLLSADNEMGDTIIALQAVDRNARTLARTSPISIVFVSGSECPALALSQPCKTHASAADRERDEPHTPITRNDRPCQRCRDAFRGAESYGKPLSKFR